MEGAFADLEYQAELVEVSNNQVPNVNTNQIQGGGGGGRYKQPEVDMDPYYTGQPPVSSARVGFVQYGGKIFFFSYFLFIYILF